MIGPMIEKIVTYLGLDPQPPPKGRAGAAGQDPPPEPRRPSRTPDTSTLAALPSHRLGSAAPHGGPMPLNNGPAALPRLWPSADAPVPSVCRTTRDLIGSPAGTALSPRRGTNREDCPAGVRLYPWAAYRGHCMTSRRLALESMMGLSLAPWAVVGTAGCDCHEREPASPSAVEEDRIRRWMDAYGLSSKGFDEPIQTQKFVDTFLLPSQAICMV